MKSIEHQAFVDNEYKKTSPDDVRAVMGSLLDSAQTEEDMNRVSETIKSIQSFLLNAYPYDDLQASPYYHAVVGSSMRKGAEFDENNPTQRQIASTIILRIQSFRLALSEQAQFENRSDLYTDILNFKTKLVASKDRGLVEYFDSTISAFISNLQQQTEIQLTAFPEIDLAIGGSGNSNYNPEGSEEEKAEILKQFKEKFAELKTLISQNFKN